MKKDGTLPLTQDLCCVLQQTGMHNTAETKATMDLFLLVSLCENTVYS